MIEVLHFIFFALGAWHQWDLVVWYGTVCVRRATFFSPSSYRYWYWLFDLFVSFLYVYAFQSHLCSSFHLRGRITGYAPVFLLFYIGCEEEHTVGYSVNVNLYGLDSLSCIDSVLDLRFMMGEI